MAVSAFKSSSRRNNLTNPSSSSSSKHTTISNNGGQNPEIPPKKQAPTRRSRSVSAFSRTSSELSSASSHDFLNKRDNPLFSATPSPPELDNPAASVATGSVVADSRRGRSVARNSDVPVGGRKEAGRSLSRGDTGRRNRSASTCPVSRKHYVNSESEAEQECGSAMSVGNRRSSNLEVEKKGLVRTISSSSDMVEFDQLKGLHTWSSQHSALESSHDYASALSCSHPETWEDGVSTTSSLLGVEEKTIKAVCEQMKSSAQGDPLEGDATASGIYETVRSEVRRAISEIQNDLERPSRKFAMRYFYLCLWLVAANMAAIAICSIIVVADIGGYAGRAIRRSNTSPIAITNIADIPPDLVNPSAVELVLDIRREYSEKLEQSQERARKLRGDLAVEEHRGQELSRILKEASIERRKMSRRLTEEALTYFDECVSLSTFDSSDFSSPEDLPVHVVGFTTPVDNSVLSLQASSSASATNSSNSFFKDKQESGNQDRIVNSLEAAELTASGCRKEPTLDKFSPTSTNAARDSKSHFSFARKPTETPDFQHDIQKYIVNSEKGSKKGGINSLVRSKSYELGEYNLQAAAQSFVFDRVVMKNRIESGSLLLCNGGISVSFSPFSSFV
ncbi:hypothetical protein PanWU01x14_157570 [Parasponia andersonii]|uniref:Transmembrane protein n=1 Tax=Parasponia andersonii TaxID=3476 RepID=A0A2P5CF58_PARAD|nr:hypothetical protein PanWU01x14_157570 [Parasponia andersonii]